MSDIIWPEGYVPGFTDNYVSNEVIVTGLSTLDVWELLSTPSLWPTYYKNASNTSIHDNKGPELAQGVRFFFETFGFPIEAEVVEFVPPVVGQPARLAWHAWTGSTPEDRLDVLHAWLIEDLSAGRLRILTQETQNGKPAIALANDPSHPMINGHQDWLYGIVSAARIAKKMNAKEPA